MRTQELNITPWLGGKPPCVGLWIASRHGNPWTKRWFNGVNFSIPVTPEDIEKGPEHLASLPAEYSVGDQRYMFYRGLDQPSVHGYTYELVPTQVEV